MPNVTSVTITSGVPTAGSGTVSTLDALMADGGQATLGTTTAAAVVTDAAGTLQQYLRGLVKLFASATFKAASTAPVASDTALVVAISPNSVNANGRTVPGSSAPVVLASQTYKTVAASATATVMGATGAAGDFLDGILVIPATTSPGNVLLLDNATSITVFAGGATSVSNLIPFFIPIGALSASGAWKITTGTNVSVIGIGNFT